MADFIEIGLDSDIVYSVKIKSPGGLMVLGYHAGGGVE